MCTEYTVAEMHRLWTLYSKHSQLPAENLTQQFNAVRAFYSHGDISTKTKCASSRSAGPLLINVMEQHVEVTRHYLNHGHTFTSINDISNAQILNPTFVYSLAGDTIPNYAPIDPSASFHLAHLYGNATGRVTIDEVVTEVKRQFESWLSAT